MSDQFRRRYRRLNKLENQGPNVCKVLRLQDARRSLFYLVIKKYFYSKPSCKDLWVTLLQLRRDAEEQGCPRLAKPKIDCGLDLDWIILQSMLEIVFRGFGIRIIVYCFQPAGEEPSRTVTIAISRQPVAARRHISNGRKAPVKLRHAVITKKRTEIPCYWESQHDGCTFDHVVRNRIEPDRDD
ncbi:hypothetical protein ILUMI_23939 [Ignelater luminosus]|uniref:Uncharacterized protein n=1 Tax=Ignelater luminosus TaxID=2038154 RepID=A0A8K0CEF9_IGNLU|nr:hypothetical protein ILUMI_23939 [Ignelater luminosus]